MPVKQSQRAEVNSFVKGLVTEASPLNFPGDASAAEENFELNRDGTRNRRLGMDFEDSTSFLDSGLTPAQLAEAGISTFKWVEVAGNPWLEFLVVQFNKSLYFFDLASAVTSLGFKGSVTLSSFPDSVRYSFSTIEGFLVAVAGVDVVAQVAYEGDTFQLSYSRLQTRDLWGIEETNSNYETDPAYRGPLDPTHKYNLQNQSWGIPRVVKGSVLQDVIYAYNAKFGVSPSNSEQVWPGLQYTPVGALNAGDEPTEVIYLNLYEETLGAYPKSAKGYFIIDVLRRGQSRVDRILQNNSKYPELYGYPTPFPSDFTPGGPSTVAEFAGRVFYTGFSGGVIDGDKRSPNLSNYVFFSQVVSNGTDITKCYQEGDPTSRESPDIIDTDGGFLRISEAKNIIGLVNLGSSLIAIASNGVWQIQGGSDYGFSASNYKVVKISTYGGLSSYSLVSEGDRAYYWAEDGIYIITKNQFGDYEVQSLTISTIQSIYEDIPFSAKLKSSGVYDNSAKKIKWLFSETGDVTTSTRCTELILDIPLGAFYLHRITTKNAPFTSLLASYQSNPYSSSTFTNFVLVDHEPVFSGIDPVAIDSTSLDFDGIIATKYLSVKQIGDTIHFNFSLYKDYGFVDWASVDGVGVDAKAFCLTGAQTLGDTAVEKQIPYLLMHFEQTEGKLEVEALSTRPSGCMVRAQWNAANSVKSNQWTPLMQAYRFAHLTIQTEEDLPLGSGYAIVTSKTKLRGKGRAIALYFETEPGKDCRILGWNLTFNGNSYT